MWTNHGFEFSQEILGQKKFRDLLQKKKEATPSCVQNLLGRSALSLASHRAIEKIHRKKSRISPILRRHNAVGAVGYAHVCGGNVLQSCDFFKPDRCFKIRLRVSNVNCEDDAASCIREIAIKFSDQDKDGLFDIFFFTGRTFLARDSNDFLRLMSLNGTDKDIQHLCRSNPYAYRALAEGLRRAPSSYADLTYYSQMCYLFSKSKKEKLIVKFRLIPSYRAGSLEVVDTLSEAMQMEESGMLTKQEQKELWNRSRRQDETRDQSYLKREFKERLWKDEPISFTLQVQMKTFGKDYQDDCNPQLIWNEKEYPWTRLMVIELTTHMSSVAIARTKFNISDSPRVLGFPEASGPQDPFSLQKVVMSVYTEIERKGLSQICTPLKGEKGDDKTKNSYVVTMCTEPLKENKQVPFVEVYITLWGSRCRSCALNLNLDNRLNFTLKDRNFRINQHRLKSESVGELLNITVDVYYRHLTESWYLRDVEVFDENLKKLWSFPCFEVVEGSITLEPGDVRLCHKQTAEVSKKERNFQLNIRQLEYVWQKDTEMAKDFETKKIMKMPGQIKNSEEVDKLPKRQRTRAAKFKGIRWEVDPKMIDFFRDFNSSIMTHSNILTKRLKAKMKKSKNLKSKNKSSNKVRGRGLHEVDGNHSRARNTSLKGPVIRDLNLFWGKHKKLNINNSVIYNNLLKNTNHFINDANSSSEALQKVDNIPKIRFKYPSVSETDYHGMNVNEFRISEVDGLISSQARYDLDSKLPEGPIGDMCRTVLNDSNFGRYFLIGSNPTVIERCRVLPPNFPVTNHMVGGFLGRSRNLDEEIKAGHVYIADYKILSGLPTVHHEADHRFMAAPLVLLHVTETGDLKPVAIQLEQVPCPDNPVWTPESKPEAWMMAKLWVRCCDFNHQFAVSHLFNCHLLMEPFFIATIRRLPSNHPCYKILIPHFRYLLVSNSLIRHHVLSENGSVDRHTSLGRHGFQKLMEKHWQTFNFEQLNPIKFAEKRGVADKYLLPGYLYRDDSQGLFDCIHKCCSKLIKLHYPSLEDYEKDSELKNWLMELVDFGFPGHLMKCPFTTSLQKIPSAPPLSPEKRIFNFDNDTPMETIPDNFANANGATANRNINFNPTGEGFDEVDSNDEYDDDPCDFDEIDNSDRSMPKGNIDFKKVKSFDRKKQRKSKPMEMMKVSNPEELAEMLATIIFTITCQHSATHSDAMDLFGFIPDVPAMMRKSPKSSNFSNIDIDSLIQTLPDQYPEAYYASLLFILNAYKPDQNILGEMDEVYFVDDESWQILKLLKKNLRELTTKHRARNLNCGIKYECLVPQFISASPEPLPYIPSDILEKATKHLGPTMTINSFLEQMSMGTISPFVLELCVTFHETLGGRSSRGVLDESFQEDSQRQGSQRKRQFRKTVSVNYSDVDDYRHHVDGDYRFNIGIDPRSKLTADEKRKEFRNKIMSTEY